MPVSTVRQSQITAHQSWLLSEGKECLKQLLKYLELLQRKFT